MRNSVILLALLFLISRKSHAKVVGQCDVVKALERAGITRTFLTNWICLVKNESGFKTNHVAPSQGASFSYGIFQISSLKYCAKGRRGGLCNSMCESFLDENINDDAECAKKIFDTDGFKVWNGWVKYCKSKPLPPIGNCNKRRSPFSFFKNLIE